MGTVFSKNTLCNILMLQINSGKDLMLLLAKKLRNYFMGVEYLFLGKLKYKHF